MKTDARYMNSPTLLLWGRAILSPHAEDKNRPMVRGYASDELWDAELIGRRGRATAEIRALDNSYVLRSSRSELAEYYFDRYAVSPTRLHVERMEREAERAIQVDVQHDPRRAPTRRGPVYVPGTQLRLSIPFEGEADVWNYRAGVSWSDGSPRIEAGKEEIVVLVEYIDDSVSPEALQREVQTAIRKLSAMAERYATDSDKHNRELRRVVETALDSKLSLAKAALGAVEALGIPLKRSSKPANFIRMRRRPRPVSKRPQSDTTPFEPEPELAEEEYAHILGVMRGMSLAAERNPSGFSEMGEESLRDILLTLLNGHYEGSATAETFNREGKTDILVRVEDRNVFIAECKIWDGPRKFGKAIDQLLRYLTWRDSKTAILVFSRQTDTLAVGQKMHEVMTRRPEYVKTVFADIAGDSRYILVSPKSPGREIVVTTQLYDVSPRSPGGNG